MVKDRMIHLKNRSQNRLHVGGRAVRDGPMRQAGLAYLGATRAQRRKIRIGSLSRANRTKSPIAEYFDQVLRRRFWADRSLKPALSMLYIMLCLLLFCQHNLCIAAIRSPAQVRSTSNPRSSSIRKGATGAVYYVATTGNDSSPGDSRNSPWRSIQHAAQAMNPGDTAMVEAGQYDERVVVTKSGQPGKPISFNAERDGLVRIQGFQIAANYVKVAGFDI